MVQATPGLPLAGMIAGPYAAVCISICDLRRIVRGLHRRRARRRGCASGGPRTGQMTGRSPGAPQRAGSVRPVGSKVAGMATASAIGPDLGPSPGEDGVPAFDATCEWSGAEGLKVRAGIVDERDPERGNQLKLNERARLTTVGLATGTLAARLAALPATSNAHGSTPGVPPLRSPSP